MSRQFIQLINTPDSDSDLYLLDLSIYLLKTKNRTGRLQVPCVIPGTQSTTVKKNLDSLLSSRGLQFHRTTPASIPLLPRKMGSV